MPQDAANWEILQSLFHLVEEAPEADRKRILEENCDDAGLRDRVMAMVGALDPVDEPAEEPAKAPAAGRIGPYSLVRLLGAGGVGSVYLVERMQGGAPKRMALKG